jgi:Cysteine rich repeat
MKTLTCLAALSAALLMTQPAFAASAIAKACRTDIKAQCGDEAKTGGAALKNCMKKHFSDLSADCQVSIIRATAVRKDCRADAKKFCSDAKGAALASCMKSHAADLSDDCKEALAKDSAK